MSGQRGTIGEKLRLFRWGLVLQIFFAMAAVAGATCKLIISMNTELNSDTVTGGMVLMEMFRHNNYALSGYYFPVLDPYIFDDILLFHALPQLLSNYSPAVLLLTSYIIFLLVVLVFTAIVYYVTRDLTKTLCFAALATTISPSGYFNFASPQLHIATILFAGIFILLFLFIKTNNYLQMALLSAVSAVVVFSDSIFLAYFVIPVLAWFILFGRKDKRSAVTLSVFALASFAALFIKYFIGGLVLGGYQVHFQPSIRKVDYFFVYLSGLLNDSLTAVVQLSRASPIDFLIMLLFLALLALAVMGVHRRSSPEYKYANLLIAVSTLLFFFGLTLTSLMLIDGHYLTYTALMILLAVMLNVEVKPAAMTLVAILVVAGLVSNVMYTLPLDGQPNKEQYDVIRFLESKNLTFGYGNYWDANLITYLSNERVTVRPVNSNESTLRPFRWFTSERWYDSYPDSYFIITSTIQDPWPHSIEMPGNVTPVETYRSGSYTVFLFNNSSILYGLNRTPMAK